MADEPDRRLLERFVQGDQSAFESLFRQFQRDVHAWILRITRDSASADDALVEAFWHAYRSRARFDVSRSFGAWMRRIATNAAIDQLHETREIRDEVRRGGPLDPPSHDPPKDNPPSHDMRESIRAAFDTLPPRLAVVARLALIEELPYAEIAEALEVPIGTVKSRVFRATRLLREELARLGVTS